MNEYDDDDMDEESIDGAAWEAGWYATCYADKSEKEQWEEDNPYYPYEDALTDEEIYGDDIISVWREYRDEKSASDDSDEFPSFSDWQDSRKVLETEDEISQDAEM